jgi:protein-S-isoprenylcysteine O-methyltransferase Ste14
MTHYLISLLAFLFFGWIHTLTAKDTFKESILNRIPGFKHYYRAVYSFGSVVYLGVWYVYLPPVNFLFYKIDEPLSWIFLGIQGLSALGLLHAVFISYPLIFIGLKQLILHPNNEFYLDEPKYSTTLRIRSVYRFVRHPMYFWSILYLLMNPVMTDRHLFMTLLFIAYFYWGSFPEEKKLVARFGKEYEDYQNKVPRLIPGFKKV